MTTGMTGTERHPETETAQPPEMETAPAGRAETETVPAEQAEEIFPAGLLLQHRRSRPEERAARQRNRQQLKKDIVRSSWLCLL